MEPATISKGVILVYGIPGSGKTHFSQTFLPILSKTDNSLIFYLEIDMIESFLFDNTLSLADFTTEIEKLYMEKGSSSGVINIADFLAKFNQVSKKISENALSGPQINGTFDNKIWKLSRDTSLVLSESIIKTFSDSGRGFILVLDDNFLLKSMRKKYYQLCNRFGIGYCEIFINATLEQALLQNLARPQSKIIPEEVIKRSLEKIEGKLANCLELRPKEDNFELNPNFFTTILKLLKEPVVIKSDISKEFSPQTQQNFLHVLDLKCREKISLLNKTQLSQKKHLMTQQINQKLSLFKKNYHSLVKYLGFQKNHKESVDIRAELQTTHRKIFSGGLGLEDLESQIESIFFMKLESEEIGKGNKIEESAEVLANLFLEIVEREFGL